VGTHGLIIDFRDPGNGRAHSATYLPEIAEREGWSRRYTVESLIRKSGFNGDVNEALLRTLRVTRYQSSPLTRRWQEYAEHAEARRRNAANAASRAHRKSHDGLMDGV
jgi:AMMECR1 domain-containing protein